MLQAAFRQLQGPRLHGFSLLLALGDRPAAAAAASDALAAAMPRLGELRHPERAAAWLRGRVRDRLMRARRASADDLQRRETLRSLGAADAVVDGLAALPPRQRAAVIAADIERLEPLDVELVIGLEGAAARRLIARARRRYLAAATAALDRSEGLEPMPTADGPPGQLATRIAQQAERTLGGSWGAR